ncbi:uncharacterized protein [Macrobrachium rosenbergii]|uniref:uncharacterized protein n=1 Tax=Macrobrachium rosenbergii TaxID=79674 RepID=UPI0034D3A8F4
MEDFVFDPAEFLGSADCIKHLPVLSKNDLVSCARWLGIPLRAADTKNQLLVAVKSKIVQGLAEAENLVRETESVGGSDSEHEENPLPGNPLAPVHPLVESKEDNEFNLICKRIELRKLEFEENERARTKEEQFDDWLKSRQVVSFSSLRELMLLENSRGHAAKELKVYLEEVKAINLGKAAQIADEFVLTHRTGSVEVRLSFPGYDKVTELAVVESLPIPGMDGILGNDMLNSKGQVLFPILSVHTCPVAVTMRAAAKAANLIDNDDDLILSSLEVDVERPRSLDSSSSVVSNVLRPDWDRLSFIEAQKKEFSFDLGDTADLTKPRFCVTNGLLYRISCPSTDDLSKTSRIEQIVVPPQFRKSILSLSHDDSFSSHFGVWKTFRKLAKCFWWPGLKSSVKRFVNECEVCQVMGNPIKLFLTPLKSIPVIGEPFVELVIDVVGPLPKTKSGFTHLLTIMDRASRSPEAFPMQRITSKAVFDKLIEFFSRYGLPRIIQTDCGTNFTSKVSKSKCAELAIRHNTSVPYHPESQGVVERFHQTLKSILKKYCYEQGEKWDKGLPFALFALRNHPNSSNGVAPFELVFGHKVRGPLEIFHEMLETGRRGDANVGELVEDLRKKLSRAWKFARENLVSSQAALKLNFNRKSKAQSFEPGELVLVLSTDSDNFLEPRYKGPWKVLRKLSENSPGRTSFLQHDVDVGSASPVKQSPYQLNPVKRDIVDKEIKYMLEHDLIQPSVSPWSSPIVLVKKPDGKFRTEIYIDDLVVHSNDWRTHMLRFRKVFEALRATGLVVNLAKCEFGKAKVCYLGHGVGLGQVAPKQANLEAIINLKRPCNVREVRRVLGMTGYYRRFVRNFSDLAQPLTKLLEKGQRFVWSPQLDASDIGIGGVLFQRNEAGEVHPVSYYSRKLLAAERRYSTIEKEALALVRTLFAFSAVRN